MMVPVAFAAFERPKEDATAVSFIEYKFSANILVALIAKKANYIIHEYLRFNHDHQVEF